MHSPKAGRSAPRVKGVEFDGACLGGKADCNGAADRGRLYGQWRRALVVGSASPAVAGTNLTEIPTPSGGGGDFADVSCTSVGNCTTVGYDEGSIEPMVATETNGNWGAATDLPSPAHDTLTGESCSSPGNCAAVGQNPGINGVPGTPVVAETNGVWGTVRGLRPPAALVGFMA